MGLDPAAYGGIPEIVVTPPEATSMLMRSSGLFPNIQPGSAT